MMATRGNLLAPAVACALAATSCHPIGPPGDSSIRSGNRRPETAPPVSSERAAVTEPSAIAPATAAPEPSHATSPTSAPATPAGNPAPPAKQATPAPTAPVTARSAAPAPIKDDIPTAQKAPGRPGYVLSPFTGKLMLVRGIPSGVVVPDQTSPDSGKKFRVP